MPRSVDGPDAGDRHRVLALATARRPMQPGVEARLRNAEHTTHHGDAMTILLRLHERPGGILGLGEPHLGDQKPYGTKGTSRRPERLGVLKYLSSRPSSLFSRQ